MPRFDIFSLTSAAVIVSSMRSAFFWDTSAFDENDAEAEAQKSAHFSAQCGLVADSRRAINFTKLMTV
jgi:hypothetical protein